jgi:predicted helicase
LKIKLKGSHVDTNEVIEEELKEVLNNLTEHDFQDVFKKMAEALGTVHTRERGLLRE